MRPATSSPLHAFSGITFLGFVAFTLLGGVAQVSLGSDPLKISEWDRSLPSIILENVHLEGTSLGDAWTQMGQRLLFRTVLVSADGSAWAPAPFSFTASRCTGSDLLGALVATYPDMTWTQDSTYSVIWIHPSNMQYERILQTPIDVVSDQLGAPMLDGIIQSLAQASGGSLRVEPYNAPFRNTYDHAVDLPAGTYTMRDILNICCNSDPTITLNVGSPFPDAAGWDIDKPKVGRPDNFTILRAVNLVFMRYNRAATRPTPGALQIWRLGIGPVDEAGPSAETLCQKLADPDPAVRASARAYYQAQLFRYSLPASKDAQTETWTWLAKLEIFIRMEGFTFREAADRLRVLATDEALLSWPPELATLVGMELARLDHDTRYLDVVARREFKAGELAGVRSRIHAIARLSPEVRDKLRGGLGEKLATADESLRKLGDVKPNPPRSLHSLVDAPPVIEFKLHAPAETQPKP